MFVRSLFLKKVRILNIYKLYPHTTLPKICFQSISYLYLLLCTIKCFVKNKKCNHILFSDGNAETLPNSIFDIFFLLMAPCGVLVALRLIPWCAATCIFSFVAAAFAFDFFCSVRGLTMETILSISTSIGFTFGSSHKCKTRLQSLIFASKRRLLICSFLFGVVGCRTSPSTRESFGTF